jgi:hypothetical protein
MSAPIELLTICIAGISAFSTFVVALFGPTTKHSAKKPVQGQFDLENDKCKGVHS